MNKPTGRIFYDYEALIAWCAQQGRKDAIRFLSWMRESRAFSNADLFEIDCAKEIENTATGQYRGYTADTITWIMGEFFPERVDVQDPAWRPMLNAPVSPFDDNILRIHKAR